MFRDFNSKGLFRQQTPCLVSDLVTAVHLDIYDYQACLYLGIIKALVLSTINVHVSLTWDQCLIIRRLFHTFIIVKQSN